MARSSVPPPLAFSHLCASVSSALAGESRKVGFCAKHLLAKSSLQARAGGRSASPGCDEGIGDDPPRSILRREVASGGRWPAPSAVAGSRSGSTAKIRVFKDFDQLKRKVQSLLVVANPTLLVLS
jgi:hypothetical protein